MESHASCSYSSAAQVLDASLPTEHLRGSSQRAASVCSAPAGGTGLSPEPAADSGGCGPTAAAEACASGGAGDVCASNGSAAAAQSPACSPHGVAGSNAGSAAAVRGAIALAGLSSCPAGGAASRGTSDLLDSNGGGVAGEPRSSCLAGAWDSGRLPGDAQDLDPGGVSEAAGRVAGASSDGDSDLEADVAADAVRRQLVRWRAARRSSGAGSNPAAGPSARAECTGAAPRAAPSADASSAAAAVVAAGQDMAPGACSVSRGVPGEDARTAANDEMRAEGDVGAVGFSGRPIGSVLEGDSNTAATWGTWTWADPARAGPEPGHATSSTSGADSPGRAPAELGGARQGVHNARRDPRQADESGRPAAEPGSPAASADVLNSTLMSALIHGQGAPALAGAAAAYSEPPLQATAPAPALPCPNPGKAAGLAAPVASSVSSEAGASAAAGPEPSPATGAGNGQEAGGRAAPQAAANPKAARLKPSAKAVCAVWELLEACIAKPGTASSPPPGAHNIIERVLIVCSHPGSMIMLSTDAWIEREENSFTGILITNRCVQSLFALRAGVMGAAPQVRWYDARARTALRRVAAWLNVPWSKARLHAHQATSTQGPSWLGGCCTRPVVRPKFAEFLSANPCRLGVL